MLIAYLEQSEVSICQYCNFSVIVSLIFFILYAIKKLITIIHYFHSNQYFLINFLFILIMIRQSTTLIYNKEIMLISINSQGIKNNTKAIFQTHLSQGKGTIFAKNDDFLQEIAYISKLKGVVVTKDRLSEIIYVCIYVPISPHPPQN